MKPEVTNLRKFRDMIAYMNLPVFSYIDNDDFAIIKIHEMGLKMPYITPTFRPDFYTLIIVSEGKGIFMAGDHVFELGARHVFMKYPDSYISSGWTESPVGYNISFNEEFIAKRFPYGIAEIPVKDITNAFNYRLSDEDYKPFDEICAEMYNEAISSSNTRYEMIANLLIHFLLLVQQHQNKIKLEIQSEKYALILASFCKNVDQNFNMLLSGESATVFRTKEHAKLLNVSETFLSKVISKTSGRTINQWINDRLIDEISYLLKNTNTPIPEIAQRFAFTDLAYFYTFFKRNTKTTPSSLRNDFNASDSDRAHMYRGEVVKIRPNW
ncbi:AraC family transcriptional regulator [Flavobacterium sp. CSZ]|uniref:AraC family transcriptional regulator n=1 Tax=Flavobacterium sp. CSZ TaxID=2783791 RepID=UPI001889CCCC|nr:AraC family transcriptional regulator [Flavobacterium sp. CSZ]MBF4485049.1 AraC family transcriptional regulator [Flavobacterium sp. CSZ]